MKHLSRWVLPLLVLAIWLMMPLDAWGHTDPISPQFLPDDPPLAPTPIIHPSSLPTALLLLATLAFAGLLWRRRRVTALGLTLVLVCFALALAIHSVHHLGMPEQAAECLVFTFSQHGAGALAENLDLGSPSASDEGAQLFPDDTAVVILFYRPAQQRAPPANLT
jgi:hypothetical protein